MEFLYQENGKKEEKENFLDDGEFIKVDREIFDMKDSVYDV